MSRFNTTATPAVPVADAVTGQGGDGFTREARTELFTLGVANFVGASDTFESGDSRDARFARLVAAAAINDSAWVAAFISWLRRDANMRTAALVAAAEYVRAGGPNGRAVIDSVLVRADEPGELLAYWAGRYGRNIPAAVKRGVADAAQRLYTQRNTLRWDSSRRDWRFGDVISYTHPRPVDDTQDALFGYLTASRRKDVDVPETLAVLTADADLLATPLAQRRGRLDEAVAAGWSWERIAGWVPDGMDAAAWAAAIPNMGVMACVKNLRNFDQAGVDGEAFDRVVAKLTNPDDIAKSRILPMRALTAWKELSSTRWGGPLDKVINLSLANVPTFDGSTLVLVDVSGSMDIAAQAARPGGRRPASPLCRWEVAAMFATAIGARSDAKLVLFDTRPVAELTVDRFDSILRLVNDVRKYVGGMTNTLGSLAASYNGEDRVIIVTDEQTGARGGWDAVKDIRVPVYTWNLAGHQVGHTPSDWRNWRTFGGLNDAAFSAITAIEQGQRGVWPWEVAGAETDTMAR